MSNKKETKNEIVVNKKNNLQINMISKEDKIIEAYRNGQSLNSIAKEFDTYATSITRILKKHNIELRHDITRKGELIITGGEKLIEWAKSQGRLVTKAELAEQIGTKRLSPSYFIKYPELGQYVVSYEQKELAKYVTQLFNWLKENNILYKPNDKTALKDVTVQALLLGEYSDVAIVIDIKPYSMSKKRHKEIMTRRIENANKTGINLIFLKEVDFENLDKLKKILDDSKKSKENVINERTFAKEEKYNLAKMYFFGEKVKQDYEKAYNLFNELVEEYNYEEANLFLAEMYYCSYYVVENREKAFNYYNKVFSGNSKFDSVYIEYFFNDIMIFSIAEYFAEIGCITEEMSKKYWTMVVKNNIETIKRIQKMFKNSLKNCDFDIKIKIFKYVHKYVRKFYNEDGNMQEFAEKILDELLNYIPIYNPIYVKKVKRDVYIGDIEQSIINDREVVENMFSYPARKIKYERLAKNFLSENSNSLLVLIICECIINNQLSFADNLLKLLYDTNQAFFSYEFYSSIVRHLNFEKICLNEEQSVFLTKWKDYRTFTI